METIMMTDSQQRSLSSAISKSFYTAHPSFPRRFKIAARKYLSRVPASQLAAVVTTADWKSSGSALMYE